MSFWVDWGDGRVYYRKMGVWVKLGGGQESFRVLMRAPGSVLDVTLTCRVQRALICRLGWKNKVQGDITMQVKNEMLRYIPSNAENSMANIFLNECLRYRKTRHTMIIGVQNIVTSIHATYLEFPRQDSNPEPTHWSLTA